MKDQSKTKQVLIQELVSLRQRIAELEQSGLEHQLAEKTLHEVERLQRLAFEHSSDVIFTLDCDLRVTSVSTSVERHLGYRTEELVGRLFNDINVLAPESLEAAFKDALQTLAGGTPTAEYVFVRKDGSRVIGEVSGSPLVEDGKIVGSIAVARDITDRKRAEEALRDNETKLQAIFNTVGTGILIIDRDTQTIIEANQTALEMTGLTKERIIGQICHSLVCTAQAGKCPVKDLGQSVDNSERKLIHADGHLKDILKTVYPITIKGRDCYVESFIDITDRKRAEEALRESEEKFRVLADSTPTAVMLYQDDRWVYANRAAETICGYSEKELLAMSFWDIVHPDFKPLIQERGRKRQLGEETTNRYEFKIIMKDGTEKWVDLSGASTMLRGRPAGIISVLDITEHKRAESIMQARLRLLEFANSHSMDEFLTATLDEIEALTGSQIGFYHFLESDQETLSLQNWSTNTLKNMCTAAGKGSHYDIAQAGVWVDCVHERRPIIHNDYASLPHRKGMPDGHAPVVREVVVPIFRDNLIKAIIGVGNKSTNYEESDIGIVSQLGDLSWDITERKRAEEELSRVNRALRMLSNTNQALIRITDEATLLNEVCRISVEVGGYRMAWVGFAEHDEVKTIRPAAHAGFDSGYIESAKVTWADNERGRGPGGTAILTGQPCMARNIPGDPAFAPWREEAIRRGYQSIIALPLISEGQTLGALGIYAGEADAFDAKEVEILKEMADDLAFGITALRTRAKRDQTEEALHESEERYRLITENTADTIAVFDLNLNPTYITPSILKLRGYSVQEAMTQTLNQMLTPDSLQRASKMFADQMALESSGTADPARTALIELEEYCKDGSTIWVELAASFLRDNNFKPTGILTVTRNITERKEAEAALRENRRRLADIITFLPDATLAIDKEKCIIIWNKAIEEMTGVPAAEMIGKGDYAYTIPFYGEARPQLMDLVFLDNKEIAARYTNIIREGDSFTAEVFCNALYNNKGAWVFAKASPLYDQSGNMIGAIEIIRDITERKEVEETLQDSFKQLRKSLGATIQAMATTVETRDPYTAGHQRRVADLARNIATEMGLSTDKIEGIRMAGTIHDIGKIAIPAEILSKPTRLSDLEFNLIKTHAQFGYDILKDIEFPWPIARIVLEHHERINGSGYPRNLKGEEILMEARILAVADVVESMASHRPYRPALGIEPALEEIEKNRGILYDAAATDACLRVFRENGYQLQ